MIFRSATLADFEQIWEIIRFAKEVRKSEGSLQWQDGYPNEQTIENDITKGYAFVLIQSEKIAMYMAILFEKEPSYEEIQGQWLTCGTAYSVVHRMAIAQEFKSKGLGKIMLHKAEELTQQKQIKSLRIDTNFDNIPMLKILENQGYQYCGEIWCRNSYRMAFEKILHNE